MKGLIMINNTAFRAQALAETTQENKKNSNIVPLTIAGAGIGAVGGGISGYYSKPWLKNGELSDKFTKEALNSMLEISNQHSTNPKKKTILEIGKEILNLDLKSKNAAETVTNIIEKNKELFGCENLDREALLAKIKEKLEQEGDELFNSLEEIKVKCKEEINYMFSDIKKGQLVSLEENAPKQAVETTNAIENLIKTFKKNAAIKWAAISAGVLAATGLIIGLATKNTENKQKSISTYRS